MSSIVPIFIVHEGCPYQCIFCNQHAISGQTAKKVHVNEVASTIEIWLDRAGRKAPVEVAFYGGSFTCLPQGRQDELLGAVAPFISKGLVHSIRVSTRPDYIDSGRVGQLKESGVKLVELGAQSLDDEVLRCSGRGHTSQDVHQAVHVLQMNKMQVGLQLMLGLPGQDFLSLRSTLRQVVALHPDCVRIYPALVVAGSGLAKAYRAGKFSPLSLEKAVLQAALLKKIFMHNKIKVIRMGLQSGKSLEDSLIAGPYHPAFGELVASRLMLQQTRRLLENGTGKQRLVINPGDMSIFKGMRSHNIDILSALGLLERMELVTDISQPRYKTSATEGRKEYAQYHKSTAPVWEQTYFS